MLATTTKFLRAIWARAGRGVISAMPTSADGDQGGEGVEAAVQAGVADAGVFDLLAGDKGGGNDGLPEGRFEEEDSTGFRAFSRAVATRSFRPTCWSTKLAAARTLIILTLAMASTRKAARGVVAMVQAGQVESRRLW